MSRQGMVVAKEYGAQLPLFATLSDAKAKLFDQRDATLQAFAPEIASLGLDFSPASLKILEGWYVSNGSPLAGASGYSLPHAIGFYFGEVLCRSAGFAWIVEEFAFQRERYEIGVRKALTSIMLTRGKRPVIEGNKRRQTLWREYGLHAA
jgi:hypothetical protein